MKQLFRDFHPPFDRFLAAAQLLDGEVHDAAVVIGDGILEYRRRAFHAGFSAAQVNVNGCAQVGMAQGIGEQLIQNGDGLAVGHSASGFVDDGDHAVNVGEFFARIDFAVGARGNLPHLGGGTHSRGDDADQVSNPHFAVGPNEAVKRQGRKFGIQGAPAWDCPGSWAVNRGRRECRLLVSIGSPGLTEREASPMGSPSVM